MSDAAQALRLAQATIAATILAEGTGVDATLGQLTLRPHQVDAVARLRAILRRHRGAFLADAVGLGKTYVALAIAREHAAALVICPAALRTMWERAAATSGIGLSIHSVESLSRGMLPRESADLIIVDEAHHLRTPGTRRYEAVAHLARHARILLMSATPLQNSRRDLMALLALFAGSGVREWTDDALARLIVRRDESDASVALPALSGPHWVSAGADDDCLAAIMELPATIPAADEGVAHALTTISLVHLWASSRAALVASVRKRQARAMGLRDALAAGHLPTAAELATWHYADDALQLAFPFFDTPQDPSLDIEALRVRLDLFLRAASALIDRCRRDPDPDVGRVRLLRALRQSHPGARCVAFSQYANTVTALGAMMRNDPGVAVITAQGGRIASGGIRREEVLEQFAGHAPTAREAERIDLLLTTDLLSEGVDLRGASVIVHLDLPWNPARLDQRQGRARRLGSRFDTVHVYSFLPPTAADRMLELKRRLSAKLSIARAVVGGGCDPFGWTTDEVPDSAAGASEALQWRIRQWLGESATPRSGAPAVAAAFSSRSGWVAAVITDGAPSLIVGGGDGVREDPRSVHDVIRAIGEPTTVDAGRRQRALCQIREWLASRRASVGVGDQSPAKRAVLDRLTQTVARAPRHRWSTVVARAQSTRAALAGVTGVGAERVMAALARSTDDDDTWLQSVEVFGHTHAMTGRSTDTYAVAAVILLECVSVADGATPG